VMMATLIGDALKWRSTQKRKPDCPTLAVAQSQGRRGL